MVRQVHQRSIVEVGPEFTKKRFSTVEGAAHELSFYQLMPWACPELVDYDDLTLTMRTHEVATDLPDWRPVKAMRSLLMRVHAVGVHHRDVHVKNVLRGPDGPLLIDWECAVVMPTPLSYDLSGPGVSDVPVPPLHVKMEVQPAWWFSTDVDSLHQRWEIQ